MSSKTALWKTLLSKENGIFFILKLQNSAIFLIVTTFIIETFCIKIECIALTYFI